MFRSIRIFLRWLWDVRDTVAAMEKLRKEQAESLTAMNGTFAEAVDAMKSQLAALKAAQRAQLKRTG
jgi:hypothetical protein